MVDQIQGFGGMQAMQGVGARPRPQPLTDEQKNTIQSILSNYDPDNLTADDAKAIFKSFREAGIRPAQGMKEAIGAAGFDAEQLRTMGMGDKPPEMGGMGPQGLNLANLQSLQAILNQYDLSSLSADQEDSLVSQLESSGLMKTGLMVDFKS